jgi:Protein of unknown function (DUF3987)
MVAEAIEVPPAPRLVADDITPEAAGSLLADQGGRLAIISAEGGIFGTGAGLSGLVIPLYPPLDPVVRLQRSVFRCVPMHFTRLGRVLHGGFDRVSFSSFAWSG